jgi:hypothetical protein
VADLNSWIDTIKGATGNYTNEELGNLENGYNSVNSAITNAYNVAKAQKEQTLAEVPQQYETERNAADITKNQAMELLPQQLADAGAATDSGANYNSATSIGNTYQQSLSKIRTEQNKATEDAQNAIDTLGADYQTNTANAGNTYMTNRNSVLENAASTILSNALSGYNTQSSLEEQAAEKEKELAEQARESDNQIAASKDEKQWEINANTDYEKWKYGLESAASSGTSESELNQYLKTAQGMYYSQSTENGVTKYGGVGSVDDYNNMTETQQQQYVNHVKETFNYIKGLSNLTESQKLYLIDNITAPSSGGSSLAESLKGLNNLGVLSDSDVSLDQ